MIVPKTIDDLKVLIRDGIEESQQLEYKSVQALLNIDPKEIGKDVSAMANAAGGVIVYGISENSNNKHLPDSITPIRREDFSKERLEQIINSNISPKIEGILIHPITIEHPGEVVYVVEVPQSTTAHQNVKDYLYYRRYNFEILRMQDYEIRDILNRLTHPKIEIEFALHRKTATIKATSPYSIDPLAGNQNESGDSIQTTLELKFWPINSGTRYAKYVYYRIDIPKEIVETGQVKSLYPISDSRVRYSGENTVRDIIGWEKISLYPTPNYGPSRFDPLLPGLRGEAKAIKLDPFFIIDKQEIKWYVYADHAPVRSGVISLLEIKRSETLE